MLDSVKNFAKVTLSTGYAAGATTVVLIAGDGAKLPDPATDGAFNLVWWNETDYKDPADDPDKEIVRCTARTGDTLTITRAQEGTSDVNHNTPGKTYKMVLAMTKKMKDDIENALPGKIMTTHGDILFRGAAVPERLPAGTSGQFLKTQGPGANPVWDTVSGAGFSSRVRAYLSDHQFISSGVYTVIAFDSELFDGLNEFNTTNHRFTPQAAGYYLISCVCIFSPTNTGLNYQRLTMRKNEVMLSQAYSVNNANPGGHEHTLTMSEIVYLTPPDFIDFYFWYFSGTLWIRGESYNTRLSIHRLS